MLLSLVEGQSLLGERGRYRFLSRLASGTFAVILKAIDTTTSKVVAIKCISEPPLNAIGEREAALLQTLNERDPHGVVAVVRLLDSFPEREHFCLVLELLGDAVVPVAPHPLGGLQPWRQARPPFLMNDRTGEPQHKLLAFVHQRLQHRAVSHSDDEGDDGTNDSEDEEDSDDHGSQATDDGVAPPRASLPLDELRQMSVHLLAALVFLHDHGLIHADLKPENIVHAADSSRGGLHATVKLVDFGNCIEKRQLPLYEAEEAADESGGYDIQTLAYRAPEVAMGVAIAPAMDLWSLGCVLAECATGMSLFGEANGRRGHSLASASELVEQIESLVTGGVPLRTATPHVYKSARFYRYTRQHSEPSRSVKRPRSHSSLRHRLELARPSSASAFDWRSFQDFVERLLDVDPTSRLTARAALLHPFVQRVFPFQHVFAPPLSSWTAIDTSPPEEEEEEEEEEYPGYTSSTSGKGRRVTVESPARRKKPRRHSTTSLRHALQLIPTKPVKTESPSSS